MNENQRYWIGFNMVKGIGSARMNRLLAHFESVEAAWFASPTDLREAGLSERLIQALEEVRNTHKLTQICETIQRKGIQVITWEDSNYPRRLIEIDQPPPVLYYLGELKESDQWAVAIVGTRRVTAYGRQVAEEIARGLARNGITVISGLARGIDSIAHQASLESGGRTLAVLGSGVDQIYPPEHRKLAQQIIAQGAVISDYPPGTPPESANFPPRNRIISGLAQAVVVVEAGQKSGALITAAFAAQQGRPVFAVPGQLYAPQSIGPNKLIQNGAYIYTELKDILETLQLDFIEQYQTARYVLPSDKTEAKLYTLLGRDPIHVDEIRRLSNMPIEQVSATLTIMELKGLVRQVGGMHYIAVFESRAEYQVEE